MDKLLEPNDKLELDEIKVDPLSSSSGDDFQVLSENSDMDSYFKMNWDIESCFLNDIDLVKNVILPPSLSSFIESTPSEDSQSSFDPSQMLVKVLPPNMKNENGICNTNIVIPPKSMNQNDQKLQILPASTKPTFNTPIDSQTNNLLINNNFNVSPILTEKTIKPAVSTSKTSILQKTILNPDQFSKINEMHNQKPAAVLIPVTPLVTSSSDIKPRLLSPSLKIDRTKTRYNLSATSECDQTDEIKRQQRKKKKRDSHKKRQNYVISLEEKISSLKEENLNLKIENSTLKERLNIFSEISSLMDRPIIKKAKKATALLSVVLMISLNVVPLGLFNSREIDNSVILMTPSKDIKIKDISYLNFHRRNLLWANDIEDTNLSYNSTENLMGPTFINVSESKRIDSELRKWIEPRNLKTMNGSLPMVYTEPTILNTNVEHSKHYKFTGNKDKKQDRSHKRYFKKRKHSLHNNGFTEIFDQLKLDSKEILFDSIKRQDDTFYVVSFSGDHLLLLASNNTYNTTIQPKISLVFPTTSNGLDFFTMIQIDCAVTDTKTLHIRDTHLRHNTEFENNTFSNLKQHHGHRTNITYKPYFIRKSTPDQHSTN